MSDYKPSRPSNPRDDWKVWLVVNPGTWLIPILMTVLAVSLIVHAFVYSNPNYSPLRYSAVVEEAVVEQAAVEEAAATEETAAAEESSDDDAAEETD
jgi:light-harvesting protein B-800-850 alpha chain